MVALKNNNITSVSFEEATSDYNIVKKDGDLVKAAKGLGISFGD